MPFEIKDIAGLSGPMKKLIETLGNAAGVWFEPNRIVRRAKAEAEAAVIRAEAEIEVAGLAARAAFRTQALEARRQRNLEAIAGRAAQVVRQLPADVHQDPTPVDPDWMAEFVNCAQDVSDEEMQSLWARILAGEVARGGSFSRRTLAAVRVMSRDDAESFTRFCAFVWRIDGEPAFCIQDPNAQGVFRAANVYYNTLMTLRVHGLIADEGVGVGGTTFTFQQGREYTLAYFGTELKVRATTGSSFVRVTPLTPVGMELAPIAGGRRNQEYFDLCVAHLRANGLDIAEPAPA